MSRVGQAPISIPDGVQCQLIDGFLIAKGKLGELKMPVSQEVKLEIKDGILSVAPRSGSKQARMLWGTTRALANNLISGVSQGFTRVLNITGVGYRAAVQGNELVLALGYSHDIRHSIPANIDIKCPQPTEISITGASKQQVGQIAAEIRSYRKPEPYKGKGIKYSDEWILRKEGKKK